MTKPNVKTIGYIDKYHRIDVLEYRDTNEVSYLLHVELSNRYEMTEEDEEQYEALVDYDFEGAWISLDEDQAKRLAKAILDA